jgi:4-methylaminobutanoate oxidase (formaldehyde-forming)
MSYVGEAGWEITCKAENAAPIYAALVAAGATPAGLYAQTSMRIEKGFCAMGHELDGDTTPIAAGLDFAVRKGGGHVGAEALAAAHEAGAKARVITVVLDNQTAVPLGHEPIYLDGAIIGETSSAAYGYRIGAPLALGHVRQDVTDGQEVAIDIAGTRVPGRVVIGPAFDPEGLRMKPHSPAKVA